LIDECGKKKTVKPNWGDWEKKLSDTMDVTKI